MLKYPLNSGKDAAEKIKTISRGLFLIGQMEEIRPAVNWLIKEQSRLAHASCTVSDDKEMHRMQGGVTLLGVLIDHIDNARDVRDRVDVSYDR